MWTPTLPRSGAASTSPTSCPSSTACSPPPPRYTAGPSSPAMLPTSAAAASQCSIPSRRHQRPDQSAAGHRLRAGDDEGHAECRTELNRAVLAHNPEVAGSNPAPATRKSRSEAAPGPRRPNESHTTSVGSRIESDGPGASPGIGPGASQQVSRIEDVCAIASLGATQHDHLLSSAPLLRHGSQRPGAGDDGGADRRGGCPAGGPPALWALRTI